MGQGKVLATSALSLKFVVLIKMLINVCVTTIPTLNAVYKGERQKQLKHQNQGMFPITLIHISLPDLRPLRPFTLLGTT